VTSVVSETVFDPSGFVMVVVSVVAKPPSGLRAFVSFSAFSAVLGEAGMTAALPSIPAGGALGRCFRSRLQFESCTTSAEPQNGGEDARDPCAIDFTGMISVKNIIFIIVVASTVIRSHGHLNQSESRYHNHKFKARRKLA
jgi:hypothetical protein